jgi:alpha-D-xyloside xylohydrolase
MRGLFMDFGDDPKVADIGDEYMFGPALLVAPVVEQGMTSRQVYLPAGTDWYNVWTNEKVHGGQAVTVSAPIDTLPLFVRAGSILPMGVPVESTNEKQAAGVAGLSRGRRQFRLVQRRWHDLCL